MIGKDSNLDLPDTEGEIGYWIGVPFWGQGLIPEAVEELLRHGFEDLHLEKIWCGYFEGNEKSKRVQEKCGFTYHHTNRDIYWKLMDDIRTEHITCLTRSNWLSEDSKCVVIKNRTVFSQQDWVFVGQQNRFTHWKCDISTVFFIRWRFHDEKRGKINASTYCCFLQ